MQNEPRPSKRSMLAAIRQPALARLTASLFFSRAASSMLTVALPFFALAHFGFGLETGVTLALRLIPNVLLGVFVGHLVDRWEPRAVAFVTGVAQACLILAVPFIVDSLALLQIALLAEGVIAMFGFPARMALRPMIIAKGDEALGNSWIVTAERLSSVLGPALVGVLIASKQTDAAFFLASASTLLGAVLISGTKTSPRAVAPAERPSARDSMRTILVTGPRTLFQIVTRDRMLRAIVLTAFSYVAAVSFGEIFIIDLARTNFADLPGANGWLMAAMGAGGVAGALLGGSFGRFHPGRLYFPGEHSRSARLGCRPPGGELSVGNCAHDPGRSAGVPRHRRVFRRDAATYSSEDDGALLRLIHPLERRILRERHAHRTSGSREHLGNRWRCDHHVPHRRSDSALPCLAPAEHAARSAIHGPRVPPQRQAVRTGLKAGCVTGWRSPLGLAAPIVHFAAPALGTFAAACHGHATERSNTVPLLA